MARSSSTVDPQEVAHFGELSERWWDPKGPMRPLHKLNPLRIEWLRDRIARHFPSPDGGARNIKRGSPLAGLAVLDIGCGAGLLSEPMARLGGQVTGIDPVEKNIAVARTHAEAVGLSIDYRAQTAETVLAQNESFDVVLAMEVVEHVVDLQGFLTTACSLVRPDGLIFFSTLNRTLKSFALGIVAAEYVLRWVPRGTHRWDKFVTPAELAGALTREGFTPNDKTGVVFDPFGARWLASRDMDVNYMISAARTRSSARRGKTFHPAPPP